MFARQLAAALANIRFAFFAIGLRPIRKKTLRLRLALRRYLALPNTRRLMMDDCNIIIG